MEPAGFPESADKALLQGKIYLLRRVRRLGAFQEAQRGAGVDAVQGTAACGIEVSRRVRGPPTGLVSSRAELAPVAERLFQEVAGELVQLHQDRDALFEPPGVALVQLGPVCLGQR